MIKLSTDWKTVIFEWERLRRVLPDLSLREVFEYRDYLIDILGEHEAFCMFTFQIGYLLGVLHKQGKPTEKPVKFPYKRRWKRYGFPDEDIGSPRMMLNEMLDSLVAYDLIETQGYSVEDAAIKMKKNLRTTYRLREQGYEFVEQQSYKARSRYKDFREMRTLICHECPHPVDAEGLLKCERERQMCKELEKEMRKYEGSRQEHLVDDGRDLAYKLYKNHPPNEPT